MYLGNGVKIHDWDLREILNEKRKRLLKIEDLEQKMLFFGEFMCLMIVAKIVFWSND